MIFSSPTFFVFFAIYFCFHLTIPRRFRNYLVIAGSTVFYSWWNLAYAWLPYLLMAIAFGGAQWVALAKTVALRRRRLTVSVVCLFTPLVFFKYTNFLYREGIGAFWDIRDDLFRLPLPLGVSFITFTLTAYVVDIYRGIFPSGAKPSQVLAYVLFFPHLIAGPILRPAELLPQLARPHQLRRTWIVPAVAIFTLGLVKKLVFVDPMSEVVEAVYGAKGIPSAPETLLALYGFSAQIYCDFSGYTDMAIGIALLLGVRLPENFSRPYCADSLVDFWRRWHITLSYWLRDYLYIPLGGNRHGLARQMLNIMITMVLGGLWHGANWTFVIWGALHGIGISVVHFARRLFDIPRVPRWLGILVTFHLVTFAWVFFRAPSFHRAVAVLSGLGAGGWEQATSVFSNWSFQIFILVAFFLLHGADNHSLLIRTVRRVRAEIVGPVIILFWILAIAVSQGSSAKFVYFDF
jgi:alginate O-acetyltransferase complex protein AlgI